MSGKNINSWLEDELYQQYLHDHGAVDQSWKTVFEQTPSGNGAAAPAVETGASEQLVPLRGASARVAQNMEASLSMPLATSQRTIPVKVIDENRRIINQHRTLVGKSKVSYTHLIGWAIVKAVKAYPGLNHAYVENKGEPFRLVREQINLGIAVDVEGRDGARNLVVPNIKNAGEIDFQQYVSAFDDLVNRARKGKLTAADFQGTTISLTNPGTLGTSKVMTVGCTYDHRIIQGAESGMFLGKVQELLEGNENFYEEVFAHLKMPHQPVHWAPDRQAIVPGLTPERAEAAKEVAVIQLIN